MESVSQSQIASTGVSRLIRDTYTLLAASLLMTALVTWATLGINLGLPVYLGSMIGAFALIFVVGKTRNSGWSLVALFAFAILMGLGLGPTISAYLRAPGGSGTVTLATFMTAGVFVGLSAYAHISKKDFSAWAGMLFAGLIVVVVASLIGLFVQSSALQLTIAAASALVFSGYILFDTSRLIHRGEEDCVMVALSLYLDILNLFLALLRLLGSGRR